MKIAKCMKRLIDVSVIPGSKRGDWQSPFVGMNIPTPMPIIATTLAGMLEIRNKGTPAWKDHLKKAGERLSGECKWPQEAISMFLKLAEDYPSKKSAQLRKYFDDYVDCYGGKEAMRKYIRSVREGKCGESS